MSGVDIREAVVLTVAGVGAVFVILFLIQVLTLLLKRFIAAGPGPEANGKAPQGDASPADREKEMAAAAAVAATLALEEESRPAPVMAADEAAPNSEWRRSGREQAIRSRGRRGWRS